MNCTYIIKFRNFCCIYKYMFIINFKIHLYRTYKKSMYTTIQIYSEGTVTVTVGTVTSAYTYYTQSAELESVL